MAVIAITAFTAFPALRLCAGVYWHCRHRKHCWHAISPPLNTRFFLVLSDRFLSLSLSLVPSLCLASSPSSISSVRLPVSSTADYNWLALATPDCFSTRPSKQWQQSCFKSFYVTSLFQLDSLNLIANTTSRRELSTNCWKIGQKFSRISPNDQRIVVKCL